MEMGIVSVENYKGKNYSVWLTMKPIVQVTTLFSYTVTLW
jgi:hypothetical protein